MTDKQLAKEELATKLGLDQELVEELGAENLTAEQLQMLHTVINLHSEDRQALTNLLEEAGLDNLLDDISELQQEEVNDQSDLLDLLEQVREMLPEKELQS
jgi:transcriptional regulator with XRE-family HTH domain